MKVHQTLYCHLFLDKTKGIYKSLKLDIPDFSITTDQLKDKIKVLIAELNNVKFIL